MPTSKRSGKTSASQDQQSKPALPHERDESTSSTPPVPQAQIEQAHADLKRGLKDTDRGPVMEEAYRKQKR
jgi:hypothetical protein